jgi:hypothetical protein
MAVTDFNMQIGISKSTGQTRTTTGKAYKTTKQRFMIGKDDVYNLNVALNRQGEATINYFGISCSYWKYYIPTGN